MDDHIHPEPTSFLRKYVFSTDHKVIAKQFLWLGLAFFALGGAMAMLIRWQLAYPGQPFPVLGEIFFPRTGGVVPAAGYSELFTMHGTIMIFFAITPMMIGCFGNLLIPLQIGARDMIFPTLNMLSFWTMVIASALMGVSFFVPLGAAAGGWTSYPTLTTNIGLPGFGVTLWLAGIFVAGASSIMGAVNYITTVIRLRAPGMSYDKMPLSVWGLWLTAILNGLFLPVLGAGGILLILDRQFGSHFFVAGMAATHGGGDPILFQHLFWIFGHPEVYILILPIWGIVSDMLAWFARKPAFGYKATARSMVVITVLSVVVYGHHMFETNLSPLLSQGFMTMTMLISIPSAVFFLNWLATIWKGAIQYKSPMLFALGVVWVFAIGGLTGLFLATVSTNIYLHDTYFVIGHFHYVMGAAVILGTFCAIYFWFPKMYGRIMHEGLAKLHFWGTFIPLNGVFFGMLLIGYSGMHRRTYNPSVYVFLRHLLPLNQFISFSAFALGIMQFVFVLNIFWSVFAGRRAGANPWAMPTLEWTIPSPPAHHNFDHIPVVFHGPHELGHPDVTEKDWLGQDEPLPAKAPQEAPQEPGEPALEKVV